MAGFGIFPGVNVAPFLNRSVESRQEAEDTAQGWATDGFIAVALTGLSDGGATIWFVVGMGLAHRAVLDRLVGSLVEGDDGWSVVSTREPVMN